MAMALALGLAAHATPSPAQDGATPTLQGSKEVCTNPHPSYARLAFTKIGFSQAESEQGRFRAAETRSVQSTAQELRVTLLYSNADGSQAKQVADVERMIGQGVQALIIAPVDATGLQPALAQAAAKAIPVVMIDRATAGAVCRDFITRMGWNFYQQGARAADALAKATGGHAKVVEIQGAYGTPVEAQRTAGFAKELRRYPGITLLAAQTGNGSATDAQAAMAQMLRAHPNAGAVFAQSDLMALGAMAAISQAGRQPGRDIKIVSIDGTRDLVQAVADGRAQADVETGPWLGPGAFQALQDWFDGKPVPQAIFARDHLYTAADAADAVKRGMPY